MNTLSCYLLGKENFTFQRYGTQDADSEFNGHFGLVTCLANRTLPSNVTELRTQTPNSKDTLVLLLAWQTELYLPTLRNLGRRLRIQRTLWSCYLLGKQNFTFQRYGTQDAVSEFNRHFATKGANTLKFLCKEQMGVHRSQCQRSTVASRTKGIQAVQGRNRGKKNFILVRKNRAEDPPPPPTESRSALGSNRPHIQWVPVIYRVKAAGA